MQLNKKIWVDEDVISLRIDAARSKFAAMGFRPVRGSTDHFERGSRFQTPFAMRPHLWHVSLALLRTDQNPFLNLTMKVKTTGQWVTREERDYFISLFRETCRAFTVGKTSGALVVLGEETAVLERRAYRRNLRLYVGFCWLSIGISILVLAQGFGLFLAMASGLSSATALLYACIYGERFRTSPMRLPALESDSHEQSTEDP